MYFGSDNSSGIHPAISENLSRHAQGFATPYGNSDLDRKIENMFCEIFERDVEVFFVATGTAANALAMTAAARPGGVAFAHRQSHMIADECGAPDYFSNLRLHPVPGALGKMTPDALAGAIALYPPEFIHAGQPSAVSITQSTEFGTVYTSDEIGEIADIADRHDLPVHMDGARFANALVALGLTPAQMTWQNGIDMLSFGATKNGCWCAEALVLFNPEITRQFPFMRKRAGQLFSKTRFIAAQFEAYFHEGLWLQTAAHANRQAATLATILNRCEAADLIISPPANEVFAWLRPDLMEKLRSAGVTFHQWPIPEDLSGDATSDKRLCRFVTSFATTDEHLHQFAELLK